MLKSNQLLLDLQQRQIIIHTTAKITWICKVFKDIGLYLSTILKLWCDNISAIFVTYNLVFHAWTKHMKINYHCIQELVLASLIKVQYVCSEDRLTDIQTKSLTTNRFLYFQSKLSLGPFDAIKFSLTGCK